MDAHDAIWLDGRILPADQARISVLDHGLTVGDGAFETLKVVDGRPFALRRHLERLRRSTAGLDLPLDRSDDELAGAIAAVIEANGCRRARLRLTVTGGPAPLGSQRGDGRATVVVATSDLAERPDTTTAAVVPWRRNELGAVAGLKTTSYAENVVALARARQLGASEALLANTAGALCEGTGSNVFVVVDGRCLTPTLGSGCLPGVTRALVLEAVPDVEERDVPLDALAEAEEVFLTSSTRDVQAVSAVVGMDAPADLARAPGPWARRAAEAFAQLEARSVDP